MRLAAAYPALIGAAIRTSLADRTNFVLQASGMAVNNGFMLLLWFLFFAGFKQVGGWRLRDLAQLLGIGITMVGIAGVFFGGYRDMAAAILRGEPDALLTQPGPILPRLLARESIASAWGDLITGPLLLIAFGGLTAASLPIVLLCMVCATVVFVSAAVSFASL
ncbi:MAG: ABC-2 family transporter protein, partial [Phenylobacterium sp.]